jgi:superfamily II DNA or RNA helicase
MKIIKRSGLLIPTKYKNTEFYINVKEHLLRRMKNFQNSTYDIAAFYLESDDYLLIPRCFPLKNYTFNYEVEDIQHEGEDIDIEHNIVPRSEAQKRAMSKMLNSENCILQLSPGVGKTIISIHTIAVRKKKTIILVHRDPLAKQWYNRLKTFTNLEDDDISRITSATFEKDLEKSVIIVTSQTFTSLLKRNREKFLTALNDANIGIFIADEVHTSVGAPTFSECSIHIPSKYTYGLSATPYRYDGNGDIIEYHLGEIFADDDTEGTMDAKVTVILLDYQIDTPRRYTYIRWGGEFQRARYLNLMKKSETFMNVVKGLLTKFKDERDLICISERIKLNDELYKWIPSNSKGQFYGKGGLDQLDYKITFATPGKCRDGIDAPQKDCVIMTSPTSNIKQLAGRVCREIPDKKEPLVIDMVDYGCRDISRSIHTRMKYYEQKKWPVQFLLATQTKIIKIDQDRAYEIINGAM